LNEPQSDYDSPWKEALEQYFEAFLALFFPDAHAVIDWMMVLPAGLTQLSHMIVPTTQRLKGAFIRTGELLTCP
jgi:hypothetical protein